MTDIVGRLRRHLYSTQWKDAQEAADEIERLRAALEGMFMQFARVPYEGNDLAVLDQARAALEASLASHHRPWPEWSRLRSAIRAGEAGDP